MLYLEIAVPCFCCLASSSSSILKKSSRSQLSISPLLLTPLLRSSSSLPIYETYKISPSAPLISISLFLKMGGGNRTSVRMKTPVPAERLQDRDLHVVPVSDVAEPLNSMAPIVSSYNDRIRPLIDAVDKLRHLNIMKEGIQLPTIVVVGDQSSGKSSVLESLAGISLPRGQGICTRVPLIMRLQNSLSPQTELFLEFNGKHIQTDENNVSDAINMATQELAGNGKGISNTPLTLEVRKNGVPDLTMVDLPGITRVPVHGQPEDIYDQIKKIIMEYIEPKESIILNVLSATVDFSTCESIRMSQIVDKSGERTLAVVTKADKAPEGLYEKVNADDVNIGLGYVCVRNRIGEESYEEARAEEFRLFNSHHLLSTIDKSIVGIPILARKLVQIQASSISRNLPEIVNVINDKLNRNIMEYNKLPKNPTSVAEAMTSFMKIIVMVKESLRKILLRGEFDEYPEEKYMHCTARLVEMLNQFSNDLFEYSNVFSAKSLMEEINLLEESNNIGLPNFVSRSTFLILLQKRVNEISTKPMLFTEACWRYIEHVLLAVLTRHSENYYQLQLTLSKAAHVLIEKMEQLSQKWVTDIVEMEKLTDYTCNQDYLLMWNELMSQQEMFIQKVLHDEEKPISVHIEGYGDIKVGEMRNYPHALQQAFDLRMRMTAYWKIVVRRMVDSMALHMQHSVDGLIVKYLETEIATQVMGPRGDGMERLLEESPSLSAKREKLNRSILKLRQSKEVLGNIIDRIVNKVDY